MAFKFNLVKEELTYVMCDLKANMTFGIVSNMWCEY